MHKYQDVNAGLQPIQGGRKFYEIPIQGPSENDVKTGTGLSSQRDPVEFASYINSNIIGSKAFFASPYGRRRVVYSDHVASGRSVEFIEDFLR